MEEKEQCSEFACKVLKGVRLASKKLVHEMALRGESLVISDKDGNILHIPAQRILDEGLLKE